MNVTKQLNEFSRSVEKAAKKPKLGPKWTRQQMLAHPANKLTAMADRMSARVYSQTPGYTHLDAINAHQHAEKAWRKAGNPQGPSDRGSEGAADYHKHEAAWHKQQIEVSKLPRLKPIYGPGSEA